MTGPTPLSERDERDMIHVIHDIALATGEGAGEASTEIAGQLLSVVVACPEAGEALRVYGADAVIYDLVPFCGGELTHRTAAGRLLPGRVAAAYRAGCT